MIIEILLENEIDFWEIIVSMKNGIRKLITFIKKNLKIRMPFFIWEPPMILCKRAKYGELFIEDNCPKIAHNVPLIPEVGRRPIWVERSGARSQLL